MQLLAEYDACPPPVPPQWARDIVREIVREKYATTLDPAAEMHVASMIHSGAVRHLAQKGGE